MTIMVISASAIDLAVDLDLVRVMQKPEPSWMRSAVIFITMPGRTKRRILTRLAPAKKGSRAEIVEPEHQVAGGVVHDLEEEHAGHHRIAGKVPLEDRALLGHARGGLDVAASSTSNTSTRVDHVEIFKAHACWPSGALGRDEFVDPGAEILQHEIVVDRGAALIDLLGPRFERDLDAEFLVEGEDDVEEVEAVDAEIVDGVRLPA